jgi:hypothetical protein
LTLCKFTRKVRRGDGISIARRPTSLKLWEAQALSCESDRATTGNQSSL